MGRKLLTVAIIVLGLTYGACRAASQQTAPSAPVSTPVASNTARFPAALVLSVLPFEDRTRSPELGWLRKGLADMLVADLARVPSIVVVQRARLEEVIREQALQLSGRVADESAVRVGRLTGATVLVTGSVAIADGLLRIDAQLLGVEDGTVLGAATAEGRPTEALTVARSLVTRIVELLPAMDAHRASPSEPEPGFIPAAKANDIGEALSREGKLFQALEEFERALAADPRHSAARTNYANVIRHLSGAELLRSGQPDDSWDGDQRVVARLVERLTGSGLEADIAPAQVEQARDGSVTLRIPVRLRLASVPAAAVVEATRRMGGVVQENPEGSGVLDVLLSSRPELNRDFARRIAEPRRVYLRLLSREGRAISVYSSLQDWRVSNWVARVDDERVRISRDKIVTSEALITGLTGEQVADVASLKMTVDSVPRERATVRLELSETADQIPGMSRPASEEGTRSSSLRGDQTLPPALQSLQFALERAWNPPVTERPWSRGYLPGNERMAIVTTIIETADLRIQEEPRLVRMSGDSEFDRAALAATQLGVRSWLTEASADPAQAVGGVTESRERRALKLRAQFRVVKDLPALNLIGPVGSDGSAAVLLATDEPIIRPR